jgi:hypothetical protein
MLSGVAVVFNLELFGNLLWRKTLFGVAEQIFKELDLEFLGGQLFAAMLFFLGHRFY